MGTGGVRLGVEEGNGGAWIADGEIFRIWFGFFKGFRNFVNGRTMACRYRFGIRKCVFVCDWRGEVFRLEVRRTLHVHAFC